MSCCFCQIGQPQRKRVAPENYRKKHREQDHKLGNKIRTKIFPMNALKKTKELVTAW